MASGGWQVFLALFIIGVVCQGINQIGVWQVQSYTPGYNVTLEQVNDLSNNAVNNNPMSIFVVYQWVIAFITVIVSGIVAVFSLAALFYWIGWPVNIVTGALIQMLQMPATLIALMWVFELLTGRQV